ncbi:unnamed protein product [Calypogeia fissa]
MEHSNLAPSWLPGFLQAEYFTACHEHIHPKVQNRNYYCVDCDRGPMCKEGRLIKHGMHKVLQVRKGLYDDVVRVNDIAKLVDITNIQTYYINGASVVFLRSRPQAKPPKRRFCQNCNRSENKSVQELVRLCSLGCKFKAQGFASCSAKHPGEAAKTKSDDSDEFVNAYNHDIVDMEPTDSDESYDERETLIDSGSKSSSESEYSSSVLGPEAVKKALVKISSFTARKRKSTVRHQEDGYEYADQGSSGCTRKAKADARRFATKAVPVARNGIKKRKRSRGWTETVDSRSYHFNDAENIHPFPAGYKAQDKKRSNASSRPAANRSTSCPCKGRSRKVRKEDFTDESNDSGHDDENSQSETFEFDNTTDDTYTRQDRKQSDKVDRPSVAQDGIRYCTLPGVGTFCYAPPCKNKMFRNLRSASAHLRNKHSRQVPGFHHAHTSEGVAKERNATWRRKDPGQRLHNECWKYRESQRTNWTQSKQTKWKEMKEKAISNFKEKIRLDPKPDLPIHRPRLVHLLQYILVKEFKWTPWKCLVEDKQWSKLTVLIHECHHNSKVNEWAKGIIQDAKAGIKNGDDNANDIPRLLRACNSLREIFPRKREVLTFGDQFCRKFECHQAIEWLSAQRKLLQWEEKHDCHRLLQRARQEYLLWKKKNKGPSCETLKIHSIIRKQKE